MESGMGIGKTMLMLRKWWRERNMEPIIYGCLQRLWVLEWGGPRRTLGSILALALLPTS